MKNAGVFILYGAFDGDTLVGSCATKKSNVGLNIDRIIYQDYEEIEISNGLVDLNYRNKHISTNLIKGVKGSYGSQKVILTGDFVYNNLGSVYSFLNNDFIVVNAEKGCKGSNLCQVAYTDFEEVDPLRNSLKYIKSLDTRLNVAETEVEAVQDLINNCGMNITGIERKEGENKFIMQLSKTAYEYTFEKLGGLSKRQNLNELE